MSCGPELSRLVPRLQADLVAEVMGLLPLSGMRGDHEMRSTLSTL